MVKVITAGQKYTDIDALAAAIAYKDLLVIQSVKAQVVLPGKLNHSVTETVRNWNIDYHTQLASQNNEFIVVDVSDPEYIADFVGEDEVVEIYDHHAGFVEFWKGKLGSKAKIDLIGAAATLIWEEYKKVDINPSVVTANLLYTAIISNTLNLNASITDKRDRNAVKELLKFTRLPPNWVQNYFKDQEREVLQNPVKSLINDTKEPSSNSENHIVIGQIELWDSKKFIDNFQPEIKQALGSFDIDKWFLTAPSIGDGFNYLFTENETIKKLLENKIQAKFEGNVGITNKLWLRKEIVKEIEDY